MSSNHCLHLSPNHSSIFISSKLSNLRLLSRSAINYRAKPRLPSSTFLLPCLNRKASSVVTRVLNSSTPDEKTQPFSPEIVGKRTDLKKIMILGAGPIVIGQACEFDYSGTQACKALREEGYEVILINSNPATIMTDPETANRTYIAPMTPDLVEQVIAKERPDALLPTMGGQTALNLAVALAESGALERYGVELIGAKLDAIKKAEDRELAFLSSGPDCSVLAEVSPDCFCRLQ